MKKRSTILYALLWIAYVIFTLTMFPRWNTIVMISVIPLSALGGWLFGTTKGLLICIPSMFYHIFLTSFLFGDIIAYYGDRAIGTFISIACVFLMGSLRRNLDAIKETNLELDRLVAERSAQLDLLTSKLIEKTEQTRVLLGQELHDGIGQQMAGIQLFCTSLADRLHAEHPPQAPLADSLITRISITHNQIRRIARMLFPIRIGQVGLVAALDELAACFQDMEHIDFSATAMDDLPELPEKTALQIYRICQETAIHAIDDLEANRIDVSLLTTPKSINLEFAHNGRPLDFEGSSNTLRLIEYRLLQTSGGASKSLNREGMEKTTFTFPNPLRTVAG